VTQSVTLARTEELGPGERKLVRAGDRDIALFNVDGTIYAVDDSCPHAGSSLAAGRLEGRTIRCRAHGLRFDLATGTMPGVPECSVATFPVTLADGAIVVEL
jgi:3-phenylpropionate/trans-cinnamate dioxygenase ferredoxin subunit